MEKRKSEMEATRSLLQYLCNDYPNLLEMSEYTHPIKGACTSIILKENHGNVAVDIGNIKSVLVDFEVGTIIITTDLVKSVYMFLNIIKDETVV